MKPVDVSVDTNAEYVKNLLTDTIADAIVDMRLVAVTEPDIIADKFFQSLKAYGNVIFRPEVSSASEIGDA